MSQILSTIRNSYPSLAEEPSFISATEVSDSRVMAELASHVVELFETRRAEEIRPAFELAEQMISTGSEAEMHAAIIGFLETIQNVSSHRRFGATVFEPYLGPFSRKSWDDLIGQWRGRAALAEVVASETGARLQPQWWQFWKRRTRSTPQELLEKVENPELRKIIEQITREHRD
jgi:hypothetical protein